MITSCRLYFLLIVICMGVCCISEAQERSLPCFEIRLTKNAKRVEGPKSVTLLDQTDKQDVDLREGQFCVPELMSKRPYLDVMFVVKKERFHLTGIPMERFDSIWDMEIGEKTIKSRFKAEFKFVDPKKNCIVEFHNGEREVGNLFFPCRIPLEAKNH
jgi:hypothetical protein